MLGPTLNEAESRIWAATEARALGHGGIAIVMRATGMSRGKIEAGLRELQADAPPAHLAEGRIRRPGAGRPKSTKKQPELLAALERLVNPATRGDPCSALRWTSKSTAKLAEELRQNKFKVSSHTVRRMLIAQGYSLQAPRKTLEGGAHPDRDAQFQYIHDRVEELQKAGQPVISVDCKKKELIGEFKNGGREWQPKGQPVPVNVYDFANDALFKAIPYGVYDITRNEGWVTVGIDHDTAEFAVDTIRQWWKQMGQTCYPKAQELLITADGGGSNGSRNRLWKERLQRFSDETGLTLHVHHLPPGTSKWNKIEHRLFSQITKNWRGKPLATLHTIVSLIANTTTKTGLKVRAELNRNSYPTGRKVSDSELRALNLSRDSFHGDWNYSFSPTSSRV